MEDMNIQLDAWIPVEPQNIYDDPAFFSGYRALRQNDTGLNGAVEVPALRLLLPALSGCRVLDLGCGFGDFARYARSCGAASVTALDVSRKMLDEAVRLTNDPQIHYVQGAIEQFAAAAQPFDLVVSSMALHYVMDCAAVASKVFGALKPGGRFVFSVEHPVCTAHPDGWVPGSEGELLHWALREYQTEGPRNTSWFVDGVCKYHRTVATYTNLLLAAGFRIEKLLEPAPTAEELAARPHLQAAAHRPAILILAATRP